jgi:hypothetical protein
MKYDVVSFKDSDGVTVTNITVFVDENTARSFPAVEGNPEFDAFIAENPDALKNAKPAPALAEKTPSDPAA